MERYVLFNEVAKQLSFSKAAEILAISRSYLSSQIIELEKELELTLLIRSTRRVRLTPSGQKVVVQIQQIQDSMVQFERQIQRNKTDVSGKLKITAPDIFSQRFLVDICQGFKQKFALIEFEIDVGYQKQDLTKQNFDLAIRATNAPPENMVAKKLFAYQHICCASKHYLANAPSLTCPEKLVQHQCLSDPTLKQWDFYKDDKKISVNTHAALAANNNFLLLEGAIAGQGIVKLPDYLLLPAIEKGLLVQVLPEYFIKQQYIYLIYPPQIKRSASLNAFIHYMAEYFNPL
jgi:DNA-binding transcriptional LysR family regulator